MQVASECSYTGIAGEYHCQMRSGCRNRQRTLQIGTSRAEAQWGSCQQGSDYELEVSSWGNRVHCFATGSHVVHSNIKMSNHFSCKRRLTLQNLPRSEFPKSAIFRDNSINYMLYVDCICLIPNLRSIGYQTHIWGRVTEWGSVSNYHIWRHVTGLVIFGRKAVSSC